MESHSTGLGKQHSQTIAEAAVPKACTPVGDGPHITLDVATVRILKVKEWSAQLR